MGREVKPKVRVVTMTVIVWFVVRSVMGITVPRIIMMVSVNPVVPAIVFVMVPMTISVMFPVTISVVVPVANFVMFLLTILVMVPLTRPCAAITCLRRRRPSDQKHCQQSNYYNLTDVFHFDSPFIGISRRGEEKGYGNFLSGGGMDGWKKKRSRSSAVLFGR